MSLLNSLIGVIAAGLFCGMLAAVFPAAAATPDVLDHVFAAHPMTLAAAPIEPMTSECVLTITEDRTSCTLTLAAAHDTCAPEVRATVLALGVGGLASDAFLAQCSGAPPG